MISVKNADAALKDYYLDAVSTQLNESVCPFFTAIEKGTENVFGKDVKLSIIRGSTGSVCAGEEDGDLPGPYANRYAQVTMPLKNIYGTIEITDKAMRASRENSGAFVSLLNAEMEGLVSSARQNFKRMLFGDGTGKLCSLKKRITQNSFEADKVCDYFVGLQVDFKTALGINKNSAGSYIAAINHETNVITFAADISENIAFSEMYVHGSYNNEITGLGAIFNADTLYGYEKSKDAFFAPHIVDCQNSLTEEKLANVLDYAEEHFNSKINMIICSYKTRRQIAALIDANRRVVNSIDSHTGYGAVTVNDVPVYADKYCPEDTIYFINTDDFVLSQLCDWEWLEDEDGKILKQVAGKAAYSATIVKYAELICKKPCGQAMLKNFQPVPAEEDEGE